MPLRGHTKGTDGLQQMCSALWLIHLAPVSHDVQNHSADGRGVQQHGNLFPTRRHKRTVSSHA